MTTTISHPRLESETPLYPAGFDVDLCWSCFRPGLDLATTADRCIGGGELVTTCRPCFHALAAGRPVELPGRDELPELLVSWARWDHNGQVDEEFTARMLAAVCPGLAEAQRNSWFECLQGALLELQERRGPGFELASVEPEARDVEALVADSVEKATECVQALIGGVR